MDLFGHAALSVIVGRAVPSRAEERRATTAAALAAGMAPDLDAATYLGGADLFRQVHQLYTHNVLALAVLPAVVGFAVSRLLKARLSIVLAAAYAAMAFHLVGDVIGLWPVPLLFPFFEERFALFLLEQDFSLGLDLTLVAGAVLGFWDPIAKRAWALRLVALGTLLVAAAVVLLG